MSNKTKNRIFIFVGIFIILSPFLGFPKTIKDTLYIFSGLTIVWLSFSNSNMDKKYIDEDEEVNEVSNVKNIRF